MSASLRIMIMIVSIVLGLVVLLFLKKGRMPLKYAVVWLIPTVLLALISILPNALWKLTNLIGFQTTSNMVVGIMFLILFFITIALTIIASGQQTKIQLLIQEISLLKKKIEDK